MADAGWHRDPTERHELRYWDGATWSEHVSDGGVVGTDPPSNAGWKPDPAGRHQLRYWDGSVWTEHVSDNGVTAKDPLAGTSASRQASDSDEQDNRLPLRDNREGPTTHALDVVLRAESFPRRGDMFDMGGIELPILVDRDEIPRDVVDLAASLLAVHSIESTERRVAKATAVVVAGIRRDFEPTFPTKAAAVGRWATEGGPYFESLRAEFSDVERGHDIVDFELLKLISVLSSPSSPIREIN